MPHRFISSAQLMHFHQKGFDHKLLHAAGLPEHALGVNVEMKVSWLDVAQSPTFFRGFALGSLAVREAGFRGSFGEGPLVFSIVVYQYGVYYFAPLSLT